ncbi:MAG: RnfABCDGE type electron transport complex subunit D [Marinilabiliales bacterium]|nr:RnfABCDGE type electron transport complex subunit D [Marinilabiliales bacterium]
MNNILNVSPSPHQQSPETTRKLMYGVVIALAPALAASIYYLRDGGDNSDPHLGALMCRGGVPDTEVSF